MEKGLKEKTGKDLKHWIKVVKQSGLDKHKGMIDFLKTVHGFTYGYANFVAHKTRESDAASHDAEDLVKEQYRGKEGLKPIYEKLLTEILTLGDDITVTPKKTAVSFIRKHQFVLIKPATKTRIDLGLKLKNKASKGRLGDSGPFGSMCTHRIQIKDITEVDDELMSWINEAYQKSV